MRKVLFITSVACSSRRITVCSTSLQLALYSAGQDSMISRQFSAHWPYSGGKFCLYGVVKPSKAWYSNIQVNIRIFVLSMLGF